MGGREWDVLVLGRGGCWLAVGTTTSPVQEAAAAAVAAMVASVVCPPMLHALACDATWPMAFSKGGALNNLMEMFTVEVTHD